MHALSIPTWIIHISSVIEWINAIWLIWLYAEVSQNLSWRVLSLAMLPALVSAFCACTWHFFDNAPSLAWLVTLQAATTAIGNLALCTAAWWIWRAEKQTQKTTETQQEGVGLYSFPLLASLALPSKETLFALSLFPYLGFLWFLTQTQATPRLALVGFYMTLVFVGVTIPVGIYAEAVYGQSLANVDVLHGGAEFFLTLSNILIALGFLKAVRAYRQPG
jgi:hypothetical protein